MKIRERLLKCMSLQSIDRVPVNYLVGKGDVSRRMLEYFGARNHPELIEKLGIDGMDPWGWAMVEPEYHGPLEREDGLGVATLTAWGYDSAYATPMVACDTIDELEKYRYPQVGEFDFSQFAARCQEVIDLDGVSMFGPVSVGFLNHVRMRGYDRAFQDVADPDWMDCYQERIVEFYRQYLDALIRAAGGKLDLIHLDEDVGSNDRLLVSPRMWRRFYRPNWQIVCDLVRARGVKLWMHSCGYCRDIIEDIIEMGIDVLNPIPAYVSGNDHVELKRNYGGRICFDGGVDHPYVMVAGSVDQVEDEVKRVIDVFAPGGGFMIQPSQGLTVDMPLENVARFFEAGLRYGYY